MLDSYYPGLSEIPTKQFLAKAPMMSGVVNEVVLMQCENEDDAAKAVTILQQRITDQAEGGAWYPESMEAWSRGQVIQNGTYVAMIASAQFQSALRWLTYTQGDALGYVLIGLSARSSTAC